MPNRETAHTMNTEDQAARLAGVFAPVVTPFSPDEEVDYGSLTSNIQHYARSGIHGYLVLGSNGENRSLTEDEKLRTLDTVARHRGRDQIVMVGVIYEAQRHAERFLEDAGRLGADFGLVLAPTYFRKQMTDDVLYRYYATLADESPLPLLIYNAPGFTGVAVAPALVGRLSSVPGIVGMKDSGSSGVKEFLQHVSSEFTVLAGSADSLFPAMMQGAAGGTVALANVLPDLAVQLFRFARDRDQERGAALHETVSRLNKAISGRYGVPGVKVAMSLMGLKGGIPRRPLLPLREAEEKELRDLLVQEGLLGDG